MPDDPINPDAPNKPPDDDKPPEDRAGVPAKRDGDNLEAIIDKLPPEQVQHTLREVIVGLFERSGSAPRYDPEVMRIAAATVEKDNDNKFKYLTQQQTDNAAKAARDDDFRVRQHSDVMGLCKPIVIVVLLVVVGCITSGIILAVKGYDNLGTGLITGTAFSVLGYLAGAGTSDIFKNLFSK